MKKSDKSLIFKSMRGFVVPFIIFVFVLSSLLFYLFKIDASIKEHNAYTDQIMKMVLLDNKLENFILKKYNYISYDDIEDTLHRFDELFSLESSDSHKKELKKIKSLFKQKSDIIESFKSLNSRMTNAVHYMYDLQKSIRNEKIEETHKKLIDEILFEITQLIMEIPINREVIQTNLDKLQPLVKKDENSEYFFKQSNQFLIDYNKMQNYLDKNSKIHLSQTLQQLLREIEKKHSSDIYKQKNIAIVFFVLTVFVLILLIINYRKVVRTTGELMAFRYAVENSDNIVLITNTDRNITYVNDSFEVNTGYQKAEVIGKKPNILKSNLMSNEFYKEMNETLDQGKKWQGELINRRKDGSLIYEKASISPIVINGEVVQYLAIKLDITELINQQIKLKQSAAVFENTQEGILILNSSKIIKTANRAFVKITGLDKGEFKDKPLDSFATEENDTSFYEKLWNQMEKVNHWSGKVYITKQNEEKLPIWLSLTTVRNKEGDVVNYIAIFTDLSEVIRTQEKADFLAYHDSLTLLPNRAYFEKYTKKLFKEELTKEDKAAILFLDLDRFKVINDTLGHTIGDELLKVVAERISSIIESKFFMARLGGDEFVIVITGIQSTDEVTACAEKILQHIRELIVVNKHQLSVSGSIGISLFPEHSTDADTLIRYADNAMYSAKDQGKNTFAYYNEELGLNVHTRLGMEQHLKRAMEKDEISLMYQPQYDLKTKHIIGAEVLVRWDNKELGSVSPEEFIPIAEDTGMIVDIGYYVFEEAYKTFMKWKSLGYEIEKIAFNLSIVQLRQTDFVDQIEQTIKKLGIDGKYIEMELTERILFEFSDHNMNILNRFRKMGFEVSIDDFGTGYSSMSYLKDLPIDTVKIDKAFIKDLPENIHDKKVTKAIIALSKSLGYKVIAEGIETREQEQFLCEHGCDIGQGYFYSKPLDAESFIKVIQEKEKDNQTAEQC